MKKFNLLLVCTGNTCRSPMAEAIARDLLKDHKKDVWVSSAGSMSIDGMPASAEAVQALTKMGLDLSGHRSSRLTRDAIQAADRVYTMTESHRQSVLALAPDAADKVQRLDPNQDVQDPIGSGLSTYRDTADQIRKALEARLTELQLSS
jgi:protein-tyrosine phosphatase